MRYTDAKIAKWVKDLVFKYYKHVPWENIEYETEPLFLPCIVPVGLIGFDNLTGTGFHKTVIPKYSLKDLLTRLKWLLENQDKIKYEFVENENQIYSTEEYGPCIIPAFRDCVCKENVPGDFYKILFNGTGKVRAIPHGSIEDNKIYVSGKAPGFKSAKLEKDIDNNEIDIKQFKDLSTNKKNPFFIRGEFTPKNKKIDIKKLYTELFTKYLIKNFTYQCYFVNKDVPKLTGIDKVLINNYSHYINTVKTFTVNKCEKLINTLFTTNILLIIRDIIQKYNCSKIDDIIAVFNQQNSGLVLNTEIFDHNTNLWTTHQVPITNELINDICVNKTIKQLIEIKQNMLKLEQDIIQCKKEITEVGNSCYYELCDLLKNKDKKEKTCII